ncbi:hypothetical protein [Undibacter mobilis]|uniref:Uncharacterized protein n=1 Tax=Undibacter mobilis TaxID=2292256 RepID=A0A371B7Y4_9BRAD|nr:hypothetical protein [Undibacter mobilis]RDV03632.1 hypothetical protein DXH78_02940 [Undibacter mobilis]
MIPCERYAHFTLVRDASLFAVAAVMFMIGFSFEPALAFDLAATVALVFAVLQIVRVSRLTEDRFRHSEVWQALRPDERPAGDNGIRIACDAMQNMMLRFAKTAAGTSVMLYGAGLLLSLTIGFDGL